MWKKSILLFIQPYRWSISNLGDSLSISWKWAARGWVSCSPSTSAWPPSASQCSPSPSVTNTAGTWRSDIHCQNSKQYIYIIDILSSGSWIRLCWPLNIWWSPSWIILQKCQHHHHHDPPEPRADAGHGERDGDHPQHLVAAGAPRHPGLVPAHSPHHTGGINSIYFDLVMELRKSNFLCFLSRWLLWRDRNALFSDSQNP